ncbi:MAG: LuxR C-terminal-related transcriptional regulator, partial [Thermomicrobiales bacterium]
LTEARAIFEVLRAAPDLARADKLLAGLSPHRPEREARLGLTNRELDVLRLAAQGLTDVEIGAQLYISSRTVSQHLRSIYGKLQIRSRSAATRFAIEHDLA